MSSVSKIDWTEASWNPTTGCTKISPGCDNCYAELTARKLHSIGFKEYVDIFKVKTHQHKLYQPLNWRKPKKILVNSMGDLFHPEVSMSFIADVFSVMNQATQHTFQLLTKYVDRMVEIAPSLKWSENIWAGVSVENQNFAWRIEKLRSIQCKNRFIVFEPLIGQIEKLNINQIHWVIVGGETAKKSRPMNIDWVRAIRDVCANQNIPFYFSKWDKINAKRFGRTVDGIVHNEFPNIGKSHEQLQEENEKSPKINF